MKFWMVTLLVLAVAGTAMSAQATASRETDLEQRDAAIHWPKGGDPAMAPVFSHNELLIHASCPRVWKELTDVVAWPQWFVLTRDVSIEGGGGAIAEGTVLRLKIFGSPISSRIAEFVPDERLSWIPGESDPNGYVHYHAWRLIAETGGCRVVTEETGTGAKDKAEGEKGSRLMRQAHELWLASLKWKSEQ